MTEEIINKETNVKYYTPKYDKVFKSIYEVKDSSGRYHLLESLLSEILEGKVKVLKVNFPEQKVNSIHERLKRLEHPLI